MVVWLKPCKSRSSPGALPLTPSSQEGGVFYLCKHHVFAAPAAEHEAEGNEKYLSQGVDVLQKPPIMGGSLGQTSPGWTKEGAEADFEFFDSVRR